MEVVAHNRVPNARRVLFNRECWLMLIGFPIDSRNVDDIRDAIKAFGRLICWQKDNILARIIVKARVPELEDVPHYIILSEDIPPPGFEDNFVFPGIGPANVNQQQFHQNNEQDQHQPLPDLNGAPVQEAQQPDQDDPLEEEDNEGQLEMDLMLSLSAPHPSSPSSGASQHSGASVAQKVLALAQDQQEQNPPGGGIILLPLNENNADGDQQVNQEQDQHVQMEQDDNMILAQEQLPEFLPAIQQNNNFDPQFNVNLNINMTLTNMSSTLGPDPGWADRMTGDPDAVTDIPADWASFFIMMLLSPTHFDWAKGFLNSEAWRFMISCTSTVSTMSFVIPESCPVDKEPLCLSHCDSNRMSPSSLDDLPVEKKKKSSTPHVETEATRSPRIKVEADYCKLNRDVSQGDPSNSTTKSKEPVGTRKTTKKVTSSKKVKAKGAPEDEAAKELVKKPKN
uniref:DUF4283 domain-containing protein n=1 Tax=Setaria viridis TaxID=4556 RepID=A0A4U6VBM5_SETVI|nr:hypothetical protein SEVIR_3G205100v2 [Setaria viridis]